ncbi:MAG: hypothetical protein FWC53_01985 [Firmicutes bacterium]|nr:hypothetical protein [Bacillota bacterium]
MKKVLTLSALMIAAIVLLAGCTNPFSKNSNSTNDANTAANEVSHEVTLLNGYTTYNGDTYSVNYPSDWTTEETTSAGSPMTEFFSPAKTSTVNVVSVQSAVSFTLDAYKDEVVNQIQSSDTKVNNVEKVTVNGYDAYRIAYDMNTGTSTVTIKQTLLVHGKNSYAITFAGLDTDEAVYQNMENSFVMK